MKIEMDFNFVERLVRWLVKQRRIFKARRTFNRILSEQIQAHYVRQQNLFADRARP